jgi:hypothetical protein
MRLTVAGVSPGRGVRQARGTAGGLTLAQAGAFQFEAVGAVDDAVQDGITQSHVAHDIMPAVDGELTRDQQRAPPFPVIDDLQQVAPLLGGQRLRPPVVDDQQPRALQRRQQPRQPALAAGGGLAPAPRVLPPGDRLRRWSANSRGARL